MILRINYLLVFLFITPALFVAEPIDAQETEIRELLQKIEAVKENHKARFGETVFQVEEHSVMQLMNGDGEIERIDTTLALVTRKGRVLVSRKIIMSTADTTKPGKSMERRFDIKFDADNPDYQFKLLQRTDSTIVLAYEPRQSKAKNDKSFGKLWFDPEDYHLLRIESTTPDPGVSHLDRLEMEITMIQLENGMNVASSAHVKGDASALFGLIKKKFDVSNTYRNHQIMKTAQEK
ncbi:hypothetical protein JXJ21_14405 [candidate division KSB1 bacterium]|nr:hypothetical protein [candidate division KSB1 bacterium]